MDRYDAAYLIWCWQQGYIKPEDREGLTNWMRDDPVTLHPNDIRDRDACLLIADAVIEAAKDNRELLGYKIGDQIFAPEDVILIYSGEEMSNSERKEYKAERGINRSTPKNFRDLATVIDSRGRTWKYSEPADVWRVTDSEGLVGFVVPTSARSWQRLVAEFGPLRETK
jgi:hypothetical protein